MLHKKALRDRGIHSALLCAFALLLSAIAQAGQPGTKIEITAHFYRLKSVIDTNAIKAIGSPQTKSSPSILHVTKAEAARVVKVSGATLVGAPKVITMVDQQAKVSTDGDGDSYSLDVRPSTKGSDTITLTFRLAVVTVTGNHRITKTANGFARVQESKALLVIENPRGGQPGLLAVVEAHRVK